MPKQPAWGAERSCLLVSEPGSARDGLEAALGQVGLRASVVPTEAKALSALEREPIEAAVVSARLGGRGLSSIIARARQRHPEVPVLVIGSTATVDEAVDAMQRGAMDFLPVPVQTDVLLLRLRRLFEQRNADPAAGDVSAAPDYLGLVGTSAAMRALYATIEKISRFKTNVLLLGESGTGKELTARILHARGPRRNQLFVPINCATLGRELLENELFGHERGAFTGANDRKKGLFELADGGTLFLDEIAEMDLSTQAKLLRVLERNEFRRVGGTEKVKVDLGLVAATNKNLQDLIATGRFREDLYYRLKVVTIVVPPLRERREDIPTLIDHFIADFNRRNEQKIRGIAPAALKLFMEHRWPGNVRELKNAIESAAVLSTGETLGVETLGDFQTRGPPSRIAASSASQGDDVRIPLGTPLVEIERQVIARCLEHYPTKAEVAKALGMGLRTLYTKLRQYDLEAPKGSAAKA